MFWTVCLGPTRAQYIIYLLLCTASLLFTKLVWHLNMYEYILVYGTSVDSSKLLVSPFINIIFVWISKKYCVLGTQYSLDFHTCTSFLLSHRLSPGKRIISIVPPSTQWSYLLSCFICLAGQHFPIIGKGRKLPQKKTFLKRHDNFHLKPFREKKAGASPCKEKFQGFS